MKIHLSFDAFNVRCVCVCVTEREWIFLSVCIHMAFKKKKKIVSKAVFGIVVYSQNSL